MSEQIETLDDDAHKIDVLYDKMMNYAASFAIELRRQRAAFKPERYTPPSFGQWSYGRWLMTKTGISEKSALNIIAVLDRSVSSADREADELRRRQLAREKQAERDRTRAEQEPDRQRKAAARALREAKGVVSAIKAPPLVERTDLEQMDRVVDHVFYQLVAGLRPGKERTKAETGAPDRLVFCAHAAAKERLRMHVQHKIPIPPKPATTPERKSYGTELSQRPPERRGA